MRSSSSMWPMCAYQFRRLHNLQQHYAALIPEGVRDAVVIVLGLAATTCAVGVVIALLAWRL